MSAIERVLERLKNVHTQGEGYRASCPVSDHGRGNGDRDPSLSVATDREGNVLLNCFAGCETEAIVSSIGLAFADLFEHRNGHHAHRESVTVDQSCTLRDYADYVRLPVEFLKDEGLTQTTHSGRPAVKMPYRDEAGEKVLLTRYRVSLKGKTKVKTKKDDRHHLYGLWRLDKAKEAGYCWLVEGESDCQTLWFHGEPAVGIPGANGWKVEWAADLVGIERLYFVVEDEAGERCWEKLAATPGLRERLYRVEMEDVKDVSDLHKRDPDGFAGRLDEAKTRARSAREVVVPDDEPPIPEPVPWPKLDDAALHGLPGGVVKAIEPHTEADPVAVLVNLLVWFGNALGRDPFLRVGADMHHPNLFAALVGESSKARKGMSRGHVRDLMHGVDPTWADDRIQNGLSSGEGLIHAVRDGVWGNDKDGDPVLQDEGVLDKRLLVEEPELAKVLKVASRDANIVSATLRQAWDGDRLQVMTRNNPMKATNTHVSLVGHITRQELLRYLTETEAANGFANRFIWLLVKRSKVLPFGGEWSKVDTAPLVKKLSAALDFGKSAGEITWGKSARGTWEAVYEPLSEGKPGLFGAATSRAEAQAVRLALIYAVMDRSKTIEAEHIEAALALWDYAEASARHIFGDATGDPVADQIIEAIEAAGEDGMTRTEIRDHFKRHKNADRINQALGLLLKAGRVRRRKKDTGGRPVEIWLLVGTRRDTSDISDRR